MTGDDGEGSGAVGAIETSDVSDDEFGDVVDAEGVAVSVELGAGLFGTAAGAFSCFGNAATSL